MANLLTTFFHPQSNDRLNEFTECFTKNISNDHIKNICFL
jgi:hypothetical protein